VPSVRSPLVEPGAEERREHPRRPPTRPPAGPTHRLTPSEPTHRLLPVVASNDALERDAQRRADRAVPEAAGTRGTASLRLTHAPAPALSVLAATGRPLAERERALLGSDLPQVRLHVGPEATASARSLGAAAYTVNEHVVLGDGYDSATSRGRHLLAHELAHVEQAAAGGKARDRVLLQPATAPASPAWDALYNEMWTLDLELANLPNKRELEAELESLLGELGAPGEKSADQLQEVRDRFEAFKLDRDKGYRAVTEWWPLLTTDYKNEDARLATLKDAAAQRARTLLATRYKNTEAELKKAGHLADMYDATAFADYLYGQGHLRDAFQVELQRSLDVPEKKEAHWPWKKFEYVAKLIESAEHAGEISTELREQLVSQLDLAIQHQIREAVATMMELGESPSAAAAWATKAEASSEEAAEELMQKFVGRTGRALERWHGRLKLFGKLTVYFDVIGTAVYIFTGPPSEIPKRAVVQVSRIGGGIAGLRLGAAGGAEVGEYFGPEGAVVGGFIGGLGGALLGSFAAETVAEFVADEIWPPDEAVAEVVD
jgi:hypothetical protein